MDDPTSGQHWDLVRIEAVLNFKRSVPPYSKIQQGEIIADIEVTDHLNKAFSLLISHAQESDESFAPADVPECAFSRVDKLSTDQHPSQFVSLPAIADDLDQQLSRHIQERLTVTSRRFCRRDSLFARTIAAVSLRLLLAVRGDRLILSGCDEVEGSWLQKGAHVGGDDSGRCGWSVLNTLPPRRRVIERFYTGTEEKGALIVSLRSREWQHLNDRKKVHLRLMISACVRGMLE